MAPQLRALITLAETRVQVLALTWWLTIILNSSSKKSKVPLLLSELGTHVVHMHPDKILRHINI